MSDDQIFKVAADLGATPRQLETLKKLFEDQAIGINKFIQAQGQLDNQSKRLELTLTGLTKDFQTLYSTISLGPRGGQVKGLKETAATAAELSGTAKFAAESVVLMNTRLLSLDATARQTNQTLRSLLLEQISGIQRLEKAQEAAFQREQSRQSRTQQLAKEKSQQAQSKQFERNEFATFSGDALREQFTPKTTLSPAQIAAIEAPIQRIIRNIERGKTDVDALFAALDQLRSKGTSSFQGLDGTTITWLRSLILAQQRIEKLGSSDALKPFEQRVAKANEVVLQLQNAFAKPLEAKGLNTTAIDNLITKLGILIRDAKISDERLKTLFNASQIQGGTKSIATTLTPKELQVITLLERIQKEYVKIGSVSETAGKAAEKVFNNAAGGIKLAQEHMARLLVHYQKFGNTAQFQRVVEFINRMQDLLAKGAIKAKDLIAVLRQMESVNFSKGLNNQGSIPGSIVNNAEALSQLTRLQTMFEQTENTGVRAGRSLFLTWENVFRLFQVQVLHQVLGQFIADMRQSIQVSTEFQISISEIRTLSQDNQLSIEAWSSSLRQLSDEFNLPLLDVVKAAYDAISNQVARGAETFEFLRTTLEFSKVTVSSAADSQNLLASAVKSYGEQNITTQKAAEVLFQTIDLGRVTASEMANSFGRVAQLASTAGVTIEELGAAIATLTVRGVRYNEAYTLVNNVLLKLIKPTEDMQKLFDKWGVSSGAAAIQTFRFSGVLRLLQRELDEGGVEKLGEIERDIRAIRGALGLVSGDAFADFESNLARISNGAEAFSNATQIIRESAGFKLQQELQKVQNIMAVDFGQNFIETILELVEPLGGLSEGAETAVRITNQFIGTLKALAQPVVELSAYFGSLVSMVQDFTGTSNIDLIKELVQVYTSYQVSLAAINLVMKLHTVELGRATVATSAHGAAVSRQNVLMGTAKAGFSAATIALTAGVYAYTSIRAASESFNDSLQRQIEVTRELRNETAAAALDRERQATIDQFSQQNAEQFQKINQAIAGATRELTSFLETFQALDRVGVSNIEEATRSVFDFIKNESTNLEQFVKSIQTQISDSEKRVIGINNRDTTRDFEQSLIGISDEEKFNKIIASVTKMQNDIKSALEPATETLDKFGRKRDAEANKPFITPDILTNTRQQFDEIDELLQRFIQESSRSIEQQRQVVEKTIKTTNEAKKKLAQLTTKKDPNENLGIDLEKIFGQKLESKLDGTYAKIIELKTQAKALFDANNLEQSISKLEEIQNILTNIDENNLQNITNSQKELLKNIEDINSEQKTQEELIRKTFASIDIKQFDRSLLDKNAIQTTDAILTRISQLNNQSTELFSLGNIEEAREKLNEIDSLVEKLYDRQRNFRDRAESLGVVFNDNNLTKQFQDTENNRLKLESDYLKLLKNQETELTKQLDIYQEQVNKINELKLLQSSLDSIDFNDINKNKDLISASLEIVGNSSSPNLSTSQRRLEQLQKLQQTMSQLQRANTQEAIKFEQQFQAQQKSGFDQAIAAQTKLNELAKIQRDLQSSQTNINQLFAKEAQAKADSQKAIQSLPTDIQKTLEDIVKNSGFNLAEFLFNQPESYLKADVRHFGRKLQKEFENLKINPTDDNILQTIDTLQLFRDSLFEAARRDLTTNETYEQSVKGVTKFYERQYDVLNKIVEARERLAEAEKNLQSAQSQRQQIFDRIGESPIGGSTQGYIDRLNESQSTIETFNTRFETQVNEFGTKFDRLLEILNRVDQLRDGGNVRIPGRALGGLAPSDTHLTWTNPGEFIMNARSTMKFAPQLRAMNMGFEPTFAQTVSNGGNTNIGDIHIHYSGGKDSSVDVRQIAEKLRREMRRGTIRRN